MIAVKEGKHRYLSAFAEFERSLPGSRRPPLLQKLRQRAIDRFAALGFPTLKDEEWRFTNVAPISTTEFVREPSASADSTLAGGSRPNGVTICGLADALNRHPEVIEQHLARHADFQNHAFTALNTAFLDDGILIHVPAGKVVEEPIALHYKCAQGERPVVRHPRCLIVMGANSQARIVERFDGARGVYFTNAVTEIALAENAVLDYYRLQQESKQAFHVATVQVHQERSSNFTSSVFAVGAALARTDLNVLLSGEGCECTLNGLYLAAGEQLIDNHTRIDHAKPHCASHELYKGILDGRAHGVFNGKIYVHQDAQKTDAKQTNKTLLLSDNAIIDTKPQLEIYADDVKCTHGASIGQLDLEQIFYLRTRGIDLQDARRILTFGFANDVIDRVKINALRNEMQSFVTAP